MCSTLFQDANHLTLCLLSGMYTTTCIVSYLCPCGGIPAGIFPVCVVSFDTLMTLMFACHCLKIYFFNELFVYFSFPLLWTLEYVIVCGQLSFVTCECQSCFSGIHYYEFSAFFYSCRFMATVTKTCMWRHLRNPVDSILDAVLTVSPNKQYLGMASPTTPATTGPVWIPIKIKYQKWIYDNYVCLRTTKLYCIFLIF